MSLPALGSFVVEVNTSGTTWTDITGPSTTLHVERDEGDVGTLAVTVIDASIDPSIAGSLRFGQLARFKAKDGSGWKVLYTGTLQPPDASFVAATGKTSVDLSAQDNVAFLANADESRGVGTVDGLRWLMNGVGVAFVINGQSTTLGAQTIVATNDSAKLWDEVLIVRDSALGLAYVDQVNQLIVNDADHLTATPVAAIGPEQYNSDIVVGTPDSIINSVTVNYQRYDIGNETTTEIPYGPYEDATSITAKGRFSTTVTLQGITEDPALIKSYAEKILARNAVVGDSLTVKSAVIPINAAADLPHAYYELGDVLTVTYPDGSESGDFRITGITHDISPDPDHVGIKWLVTYTFDLPLALNLPVSAPGTGFSVIPDGSVGTPQIKAGAVGLEQIDFTVRDLSGTTTFYGPTQPTGAIEGDLWFNTGVDPAALSRWDGADWVTLTPGEPTAAVATSPPIRAVGDATGITLVTDSIASTTVLDFYVDNVLTTEPQGVGTRSPVVRLTLDSSGIPFSADTTYAFHVVARNSIGEAAASDAVTAQLNQGVSTDFVLAKIVTGFVLAGAIQVGNISIDPDDGIQIPLADGGLISLPADGSPAVITAILNAYQLVVQDQMTILGDNNTLAGQLTLQSSWKAPKSAVQSSNVMRYIATTSGIPQYAGLLSTGEYDATRFWLATQNFENNPPTVEMLLLDKSTGAATGLPGYTNQFGGGASAVTYTAGFWFVTYGYIGSPTGGGSGNSKKLYKFDSSFSQVAVWTMPTVPDGDRTVGNDGTNLIYMRPAGSGYAGAIETRSTADGSLISSKALPAAVGQSVATVPLVGNFDYGAQRYIIPIGNDEDHPKTFSVSGSSLVEQSAEKFLYPPGAGGITWDSTNGRFVALLADTVNYENPLKLYYYSDQKTAATRSITWTRYDSQGTTHETKPSPALAKNQVARAFLSINIPEAFQAFPGADDPDSARIYFDNQLQSTGAAGQRLFNLGSKVVGAAAPTTEGFPQGTLAGLVSQNADPNGVSLLSLKGDGSFRAAKAFQAGTTPALPIAAAGTTYQYAVVFDVPFDSTPSIVVTPNTSTPDNAPTSVNLPTNTGFNVNYKRVTGTVAFSVNWTAIARTQ